jgi:hypothetical protein
MHKWLIVLLTLVLIEASVLVQPQGVSYATTLSCEPDTIIAPPPAPGDTFTVSVVVSDVTDMSGWQFGMMFNPVLLQCLSVTEGPFLQQGGSTFWIGAGINNNAGWISPCCAVILGSGSVSGTGTIAYIKFQVVDRDSGGIAILDFEDAILLASGGGNIPFDTINGYLLSQLPAPADSSDFWTLKALMPTGRAWLAAAAVDDKIYALGGGGTWVSASTINEEYDAISNTWTTKASMPSARACLAAAAVNGKVYAIGGYNGSDLSTNEEYDPVTNTWASRTSMPTPRRMCGAAMVNGKIYVIGGRPNLATNEEYDLLTDTWATKASMPTGRACLAVVAVNGKIYAIGGTPDDGSTILTTTEEYDPVTNTWNTKTPMPAPRAYLTGAAVNAKIYVMGGWYGGYIRLNNYEYDPSADTSGGTPWVVKRGMPRTKQSPAAAAITSLSQLYVFGGSRGGIYGDLQHNHIYIPYQTFPGIEDSDHQAVGDNIDLKVFPNPFRKSIVISYSSSVINNQLLLRPRGVQDRGAVTNDLQCPALRIYDVTGRLVRQWNDATIRQSDCVIWDATDDIGHKLPAGVYFVRLETEKFEATEKVMLLR